MSQPPECGGGTCVLPRRCGDTQQCQYPERPIPAVPPDEDRYTLDEARRLLAVDQCRTQGHDMLWIPVRVEGQPENSTLYQCIRCHGLCNVTYPLDNQANAEPLFAALRRAALRQQCAEGNTYRYLKEGHLLVPLTERKWVCVRCDALITFQETP